MTDEERQWHKQKCDEYLRDYKVFEQFARTLKQILKSVCREHFPEAIVQARAKSYASFAEKMARKAKKYREQNIEPTDLCAARMIASTQAEVEFLGGIIRANFEIDEVNSLDHRTHLRTAEFGYRSLHYVVKLKGRST